MLARIYDHNGKLLNSETMKSRAEERWEKLFSNIPECQRRVDKSKHNLIGDLLKSKKRDETKFRMHKKWNPPKKNKKEIKQVFEIPDFVFEVKDEETENLVEEPESISTSKPPQNQLKVNNEETITVAEDKKVYKLQIGVADFAKKVKDNEGMGISTFSNETETNGTSNNVINGFDGTKHKDLKSHLRTEHFVKMSAIASAIRKDKFGIRKTVS